MDTWAEITETLLALAARRGPPADFARLHRSQMTAEQLRKYPYPKADIPLEDVIA